MQVHCLLFNRTANGGLISAASRGLEKAPFSRGKTDRASTALPSGGGKRTAVTSPRNSVALIVCCLWCCDEAKGVLVHVDMKSNFIGVFSWTHRWLLCSFPVCVSECRSTKHLWPCVRKIFICSCLFPEVRTEVTLVRQDLQMRSQIQYLAIDFLNCGWGW